MVILKAVLMMLVIGAVLGCLLGIASKIFFVKADTRVTDVTALLPGYNCGGCGYPGCSGMAGALVKGEADVSNCKPSKPEAKEKIKEYLAAHKEA